MTVQEFIDLIMDKCNWDTSVQITFQSYDETDEVESYDWKELKVWSVSQWMTGTKYNTEWLRLPWSTCVDVAFE